MPRFFGPDDLEWLERFATELRSLSSEASHAYSFADSREWPKHLHDLDTQLKQAAFSLSSAAEHLDAVLDELRQEYGFVRGHKKYAFREPRGAKVDNERSVNRTHETQQGLVIPVPARLAPTERWYSLYVEHADERSAAEAIASLHTMFEAFGASIILEDGPVAGSFLSRWLLKFKQRKAAQRMLEGMIAQWVGMPQANVNNIEADAIAKVMEQSRDPHFGTVAHKFGHTLFLKVTPVAGGASNVASWQLTPRQVAFLDANPALLLEPTNLLQRLSELPGEQPALPS